jgi:hypothetical protein
MCSCGCDAKKAEDSCKTGGEEKKTYLCQQCNTSQNVPAAAPKPECCGKPMQEMH